MYKALIFLLVLAFGAAFAQSNQSQSNQEQKKPDSALGTVTSGGLNQNVVSASDLSNNNCLPAPGPSM